MWREFCHFLKLLPITYFCNFIFRQSYRYIKNRLRDFHFHVFHIFPVLPCSVKIVNKLLCNIMVTSLPKTTKNQVTKIEWKAYSVEITLFGLISVTIGEKVEWFCQIWGINAQCENMTDSLLLILSLILPTTWLHSFYLANPSIMDYGFCQNP